MTVQSCATNTRPAPQQALLDGLSELNTLLACTPDAAAYLQPLQQIREQLQQHRPTILLYGNYNAGKSTLINLLLERPAAKVDDIPTTASIDEYEWRGIRLLDSPGINAPIDHQQLSQAELARADLVLFVIRSGDVDEAPLFTEMTRMLTARKQICILLNCDSSEPHQVQAWRQRLNGNLLSQLTAAGISRQTIEAIPLLPANLRTAEQAKAQHQSRLLESCGYELIATRLEQWMQQQWQQASWLPSLFERLDQQVLHPLLQQQTPSAALLALNQRLQTQEASERQWQSMALSQLQGELQQARPRLQMALGLPADEAPSAVMQEVSALAERLQSWLANRYGSLPEVTLHAWAQWQPGNELATDPARLDAINRQLQGLLTPERLQKLLKGGQQLGLPWLKTLSEESLLLLGSRLNIALRLLTAGWDYYAAGRDEANAQAQAQHQALQQHQQLEAIVEHLRAQLQEQLQQMITLLFAPQRQALQQEQQALLSRSSDQEQWQQQLQRLRDKLATLCHPGQ